MTHATEKMSSAEKRIRSAKLPTISAGVMMAKVSWNMANTVSGMLPESESTPTPAKNALPSPPMKALPDSNTRL